MSATIHLAGNFVTCACVVCAHAYMYICVYLYVCSVCVKWIGYNHLF